MNDIEYEEQCRAKIDEQLHEADLAGNDRVKVLRSSLICLEVQRRMLEEALADQGCDLDAIHTDAITPTIRKGLYLVRAGAASAGMTPAETAGLLFGAAMRVAENNRGPQLAFVWASRMLAKFADLTDRGAACKH
ncbi:hypothetical protein ACX9MO_09710 [Pseudooceanicola sp. 502str34]